ncbi:hypothetical protein Pmani_031248 [Petrolisthes manimaculis]|uniref:Transposase Tc1-like domain-containing protein n=1 Tax=Petrolisthes manimaculis TaxID=1843537 RepID=A0AAE1NU90_9EUCA|nr:hypothetical protein Pmani_031248 [Petrolisthes manimaculis]
MMMVMMTVCIASKTTTPVESTTTTTTIPSHHHHMPLSKPATAVLFQSSLSSPPPPPPPPLPHLPPATPVPRSPHLSTTTTPQHLINKPNRETTTQPLHHHNHHRYNHIHPSLQLDPTIKNISSLESVFISWLLQHTAFTNCYLVYDEVKSNGLEVSGAWWVVVVREDLTGLLLPLLREGTQVPVCDIVRRTGRNKATIYRLKAASRHLTPSSIPPAKPRPGRPQKTSKTTDGLLRREVLKTPNITAAELQRNHPNLLGNVAQRTIQHRLQKEFLLPCRCAAKKTRLTEKMRKARLAFARIYRHWTSEHWAKVMWSDESSFQ